jgi:hypothetical protein
VPSRGHIGLVVLGSIASGLVAALVLALLGVRWVPGAERVAVRWKVSAVVRIPPEMARVGLGTGVRPKVGSCTAMTLEAAGEASARKAAGATVEDLLGW